jgi:hypothetical protein
MSATTTLAPSSANSKEVALPIPEPAPVTIATLPANCPAVNFSAIFFQKGRAVNVFYPACSCLFIPFYSP